MRLSIDQAKKRALIEHIKEGQKSNKREILLAPELYFDGYDDEQCAICANVGPFSTAVFSAHLREIGQRPDVAAVDVRFYEYEDALKYGDVWIGSDSVYVTTSASLEAVRDWFAEFDVSDVWEERDVTQFADAPVIPEGFRLVGVWWD